MKSHSLNRFLEAVTHWAEACPDILGAALVGSYARGTAGPDSDVDLVLIASAPQDLIALPDWVRKFGEVRSIVLEDWGLVTSLRVVYADGMEVEFGITSVKWAELPLDAGTRRVIADGMQILLDRAGLLADALQEVQL